MGKWIPGRSEALEEGPRAGPGITEGPQKGEKKYPDLCLLQFGHLLAVGQTQCAAQAGEVLDIVLGSAPGVGGRGDVE